MAVDKKVSKQLSTIKQTNENPLENIAGKFGGEFWLETQSEIEHSRKIDKEKINKILDIQSNEQE